MSLCVFFNRLLDCTYGVTDTRLLQNVKMTLDVPNELNLIKGPVDEANTIVLFITRYGEL